MKIAAQKEQEKIEYQNSTKGLNAMLNENIKKREEAEIGLSVLRAAKYSEDSKEIVAAKKVIADLNQEFDLLSEKLEKKLDEKATDKTGSTSTSTSPEDKDAAYKKQLDTELQALENAYKLRLLVIEKNDNAEWQTEEEKQRLILNAENAYLAERIEHLKAFKTSHKKLSADADAKQLEAEIKLQQNQAKADEIAVREKQIIRDKELKTVEDNYRTQKTAFEKQLADRTITQQQYDALMLGLEAVASENRQTVWTQYQTDINALEIETRKVREKAVREAADGVLNAELKAAQDRRKLLETIAASEKELKKFAGISSPQSDMQLKLDTLKAMYDARVEMARKAGATEEELEKIRTAYLLAENKIRLKTEKAQKKLDVEKKYADVQFAIKASEIIANTAVAIMQAFSQLGPIAGGIAAALMGVTGAAQLYAANKERQRVKAMTLKTTGSSGKTGERVVKQAAEGKYDVIGESDGQLYKNVPYAGTPRTGLVKAPTLYGEKGSELVISHDDFLRLEKHINYPLVLSAINDARFNRVPQRATGKYDTVDAPVTTPSTQADNPKLEKILSELSGQIKHLEDNGLLAFLVWDDFEKKLKLMEQSKATAKRAQ